MKLIQNLNTEIKGKWNVRYALYECPICMKRFKADVADVKRMRKRNCGCKIDRGELPEEIQGRKILSDLGVINGRRRAIIRCEPCRKGYEVDVAALRLNRVTPDCGCMRIAAALFEETIKKYLKDKKKEQTVVRSNAPMIRLKKNIRSLIRKAIYKRGYTKNSSTNAILGCDYEFFFNHITSLFAEGMGWHNRSAWHIDHIIPVSTAKNESELIALNHYTNLRPLWVRENIIKSNKTQGTLEAIFQEA